MHWFFFGGGSIIWYHNYMLILSMVLNHFCLVSPTSTVQWKQKCRDFILQQEILYLNRDTLIPKGTLISNSEVSSCKVIYPRSSQSLQREGLHSRAFWGSKSVSQSVCYQHGVLMHMLHAVAVTTALLPTPAHTHHHHHHHHPARSFVPRSHSGIGMGLCSGPDR